MEGGLEDQQVEAVGGEKGDGGQGGRLAGGGWDGQAWASLER